MTYVLLPAAVQEHSQERDVPGEMPPSLSQTCGKADGSGGLAFKNHPDELPVSWWEWRAHEIIFSTETCCFLPGFPRYCVLVG